RADEKASLLIGALGIVLTLLATGLIEAGWTFSDFSTVGLVFMVFGTIVVTDAVWAAGLVVWPRLSKAQGDTITYCGSVRGFKDHKEFAVALATRGLKEPVCTYRQLMVLSFVTQRKYRNIRRSMASSGIASVLFGLG